MTRFSDQVIYAEYFPLSLTSCSKFVTPSSCYQVPMTMHSAVLNILNIYVCTAQCDLKST